MSSATANPDSFTRMDESTAEQWAEIGAQTMANQGRVADRMIMLLESLAEITDGFSTDQLTHCLQTATMAEKAGADDEMVFGALMHDVGKSISVINHAGIAAEMIQPYVREDVYLAIKNHQDFQGEHYYHHFGKERDLRYTKYDQAESWWQLCATFTDDWDQQAFDPEAETYPLEHFEPLIRRMTAEVRF